MSKDRFTANPSDLIIVVVGPKGSGKTNFIKNLTGNVKQQANQSKLDIIPYTIPRDSASDRRVVLVDTPGFDDVHRLDSEIIKIIADWLKQKYAPRTGSLSLTGIIYLHRITDSRMPSFTYKHLQMLAQLCDDIPLPRVHLAMTMWDIVDKKLTKGREAELKRYVWQELLQREAAVFKFDNRPRSAQTIIEPLLGMHNDPRRTINELEKKSIVKRFPPENKQARQKKKQNGRGTDGRRFIAELEPTDFIVAGVMGPTGSGKTNFINSVTGNVERRTAGHLCHDTQGVTPYATIRDGRRIVLVDMPRFDDTYSPDIEIAKAIADWLTQEYSSGGGVLRLAGIIYLHRITDNRMSGSAFKNLEILGQMCGDTFLPRVRLVTTMWDIVKDKNLAERREIERKRDWHGLLQGGATTFRFDNRSKSAWAIIDSLLDMASNGEMLLLQEEIVEQKKRLNETSLGKCLRSRLQQLFMEQKRALKELSDMADLQSDPGLAWSLQKEYEKVNERLQKTVEEMKKVEIPFTRHAALWLFGRKSRARAISLNMSF